MVGEKSHKEEEQAGGGDVRVHSEHDIRTSSGTDHSKSNNHDIGLDKFGV